MTSFYIGTGKRFVLKDFFTSFKLPENYSEKKLFLS